MSEWKEYRLGDIYDVHNGLSKGGKFFGSGYPFLTFSEVFNNYFIPSKLSSLVQSTDRERLVCNILAGDIFVTRTSETANELGMSCVALKDYPNATYNGFTKRLRKKENCKVDVDSRFIGYFLRSRKFRSLFYGISGGMSTRASLANNDLLNMVITLPSFPEQEKIGEILKKIDDKIAVNRRICENLEAQAQALFKHWFIDFAPFKNGQFVESELGMIPEGWRVGRLGDFVSIKRGGSPRPIHKFISDKGLNWLKISDATSSNSPFIFDIKEHIIEEGLSKTVFLKAGELVLSNSATPCIPRFLCVDSCIHDGWLYFTNSQLSYEYLYLLFVNMRKLLLAQANGSVFLNLKTDIIKTQLVTYPGEKIMDDFNKIICPLFQSMKNFYTETKNLSTLRDTLLPKLMSGQIKV